MTMICKILDNDILSKIYTLKFPNGEIRRYNHNVNRNLFVGELSTGPGENLDIYYFKFISDLEVEMELAKSSITIKGYILVQLKGVSKVSDSAHRLVCWSWNGEFPNTHHVDHIDGKKYNNIPSNLQAVPAVVNTFRAYSKYEKSDQALKYKNFVINEFIKCKNSTEMLELMNAVINDNK
jgi:hypothetical protein